MDKDVYHNFYHAAKIMFFIWIPAFAFLILSASLGFFNIRLAEALGWIGVVLVLLIAPVLGMVFGNFGGTKPLIRVIRKRR